MNISELISSGMNVSVTVSLLDLKEFAVSLIKEAREQAEAAAKTKLADVELTADEVAEKLHVSRNTLWRWEKSGYLVPMRAGKRAWYRSSQLEALKNRADC